MAFDAHETGHGYGHGRTGTGAQSEYSTLPLLCPIRHRHVRGMHALAAHSHFFSKSLTMEGTSRSGDSSLKLSAMSATYHPNSFRSS